MNEAQAAVFVTLRDYGPLADHALVPIMQHEVGIHQSSSGIRSRRSELVSQGRVKAVSTMTMPSGRESAVWDVVI
jgi:hypothetical protein